MPGVLLRAPRGANGFGYDPLFVPNDQPQRAVDAGEKLTSAEMEPAEKIAVSHRGKALRALVASIEALVKYHRRTAATGACRGARHWMACVRFVLVRFFRYALFLVRG